MKVYLTGLSYKTAPVEVRERLAQGESRLGDTLDALKATAVVDEALVLSTCNRVELTVTSAHDDACAQMADFVARRHDLRPEWLQPYLYSFEEREAIRHLFRVAASLDSMVLGEPQILGQLKAAYAAAKEHGTLRDTLDAVVQRSFTVAKRVRSETEIGRNAVSVSYAAIELARQIFGELKSKRVLLIGAGKMSELAARHLRRAGCAHIQVTNRTRARAEEMASLVEGEVIEYSEYHARLPEIDIVVSSSGAPEYLLKKDDLRAVLRRRQNRPVLLIDIAVPRNIDPAVNELENVYLYDIDDLGREVEANRQGRQREADQAELIIEEEIERLAGRLKARQAAPTIVSLQQHLEELGRSEFERMRGRLGTLTPQQEEALRAYTRGLLNKIAHGPMTELRRAAGEPDGARVVGLIRRLFRLEEE